MHSLPIFLRLQDQPVILLGTGAAADAKRRLLERAGARIVGEADQARLAIVVMDEDGAAEAAVARLKARGILVNATDRPSLCDFTLPAIVDRNPVMIAIGTGGASAGLAKALRIAIEAILPASLGALAQGLHAARGKLRALWPDAGDRRHAIDRVLAPGGMLDPLGGGDSDAIDAWLADPASETTATCMAISLRSGDPDDLTLRQARLLGRADRICHAGSIPGAILVRARADAEVVICSEWPGDAAKGLTLWLEWGV